LISMPRSPLFSVIKKRKYDSLEKFWRVEYKNRINEVWGELERNELPKDERQAAEEIGVVWKDDRCHKLRFGPAMPTQQIPNPYKRRDWSYYF